MEFSAYQRAARETSQLRLGGPQGAIAPMLGLASETGSILNVYKKYLRDGFDLAANREFLREELGDLLWYAAAVATACGLDLETSRRRTCAAPVTGIPASAPRPSAGTCRCSTLITRPRNGFRAAWWLPSPSGSCHRAASLPC